MVDPAVADDLPVGFGDDELLHGSVEHGEVLAEQDALVDERLEQGVDAEDVGAARGADEEVGHGSTLG